MMKLKTLALIAIAPMIALSSAQAQSINPNDSVYSAIKSAVLSQLKDPDSAHFGTLIRMTRPNLKGEPVDVICGEVNARNSFGGYSGMSGFVYVVSIETAYLANESTGAPDLGTIVYNRFCG